MSQPKSTADAAEWGELFRGANTAYTLMVMLGVMMYSLQIFLVEIGRAHV